MSIQVRTNEPVTADAAAAPLAGQAAEVTQSAPAVAADETASEESDTPETEEEEGGTEEEGSPDPEAKESEGDKPKKQGGFQRRINKLNARVTERERELEYWKQQALKGAGDPKTEPKVDSQPATAVGEPDPDHFETHREYVKAVARWEAKQLQEEERQKGQKQTLEAEQAKAVSSFHDRAKSFAEKTKDYQDVLEDVDDVQVSPTVHGVILSSENGPEIAYELAKNRAEFERINRLPPIAAAREIGKIEARLAAKSSSEDKVAVKKTTNAPEPIEPVGRSRAGTIKKDISDPTISQSEYEKRRREQMKRASA